MTVKAVYVAMALRLTGVTVAAAASEEPTSSSADAIAAADYKRIIVETLLRRMRTGDQPSVKGTAVVRFTIERSGLVTTSSLAGSSGNEDLDRIALGVVASGLKLPAFPPQMVRTSWTITMPLRFRDR